MTSELEQNFYDTFGIEPEHHFSYIYEKVSENKLEYESTEVSKIYPEITSEKLLEMICIYNSFQNDEASLFIPFDIGINNVKNIALQVITKSINDKSLNKYYCNDVEKLKTNIQQLFKD